MDNEYTSPLTWELPTELGADTLALLEDRINHYFANHTNKHTPTLETVKLIMGSHDLLLEVGGDPCRLIVEADGIAPDTDKLTWEVLKHSPTVSKLVSKIDTTCNATGQPIVAGETVWFIGRWGVVNERYGNLVGLVEKGRVE